jgi:hypothetical protein
MKKRPRVADWHKSASKKMPSDSLSVVSLLLLVSVFLSVGVTLVSEFVRENGCFVLVMSGFLLYL